MEDELIEFVIGAAVGVAAAIATQWFLNKYQADIQNWVKNNLVGHPAVTRVVLRAQHAFYHSKKAVKVLVGKAVYVLARMVGVKEDGTTENMTDSGVISAPDIVSTRPLTPEEIAILTGGRCNVSETESQQSLLQKGLLPEKVAVGMKLIDKEGNIAESYTICDSAKLEAMRMAV